ncbi:hypothetical protein GCM10017576_23530 [Microbacterium barkeri]|uniref:Uncharacterized protein n=1 Tax=Microbacterium barkeri TaxID=33917 RepID=A0A9W6H4M5_9MICO|nr:hypothetical protein GCM10017576_23530 [Microbacterium barkeri]
MEIVNSTAGTMPFGKHKGHLLEEVARDRAYCRWLFKQPHFKSGYPDLYKVLRELAELERFMREARISY